MQRTSQRIGSRSDSRSVIRTAVTEALEGRRLMTVSLNNGLATTSPDYYQVTVGNGGDTRDTQFRATVSGTSQLIDTIYDYLGYLDTGTTTTQLSTVASAPVLGADGIARSSGTIPVAGGGAVNFTVESSIRSGSRSYINNFTFTSTGYDLTQAKFFEYLDSDILSVGDDILTVKGATAGTGNNALILTTIDPATNIRQAQTNGMAGANSTLTGFGADRYSTLKSAIAGGSYDAAPGGSNNLPSTTVTGIGPAFGPGDITTALEYGFTSATSGSVNTVLGIDTQAAVAPEIDVQGNGTSILSGDTDPTTLDGTDFGPATAAAPVTESFAIRNIGSTVLNLTGTPRVKITGANAGDFTVTQLPGSTVAANGSSQFQIQFKPTATGLRKATVTILNNDDNEGTYTFSIQGTGGTSPVTPGVADAGGPYNINEGAALTLNGTDNEPAAAGATFAWDVNGDGVFTDATGPNPTISYAKLKTLGLGDNGTFTATLKVTETDGSSTTDTAAINIANVAPSVNAGPDQTVPVGTAVQLAGTATDPAGDLDPLTYGWVVVSGSGQTVASGTGKNITFTPTNEGTYTATLTVNDGDGGIGTDTAIINAGPATDVRRVTQFVLVNADTDQDIRLLSDGDTINLAELPTRHLNVRAVTDPSVVGSVKFVLDHGHYTRIENTVPYALFSDDVGNYFRGSFSVGAHALTATPYARSRARSVAGTSLGIGFTVIDTPVSHPVVSGFVLMNADTDQAVGALTNGSVIDLSDLGTTNLNVRALTTPNKVGSVRFKLDNESSVVEDYNPYALFANHLSDFFAGMLTVGTHTLTATPFTAKHAGGTHGTALSVTFTVVA